MLGGGPGHLLELLVREAAGRAATKVVMCSKFSGVMCRPVAKGASCC